MPATDLTTDVRRAADLIAEDDGLTLGEIARELGYDNDRDGRRRAGEVVMAALDADDGAATAPPHRRP